MLIFLQVVTIIAMVGMTYVLFQSFGEPRKTLLFTRAEKDQWDSTIRQGVGSWFTRASIFGTLTLFATVYLFFIGSSKLFGYWVFWCAVTIFVGSFVTNYVTKRLCSTSYISSLLEAPDQVGGVIASVFWRNYKSARQTAALIRALSMLNIAAIIWLDFALFADISGRLIVPDVMLYRLLMLGFCCITIFYFTARYGLRGFVFADLFQSPAIVLATIVLLIGSAIAATTSPNPPTTAAFFTPLLPPYACVLFALHVTFLNGLLVLTTEPHWLRVWIFREKETTLQVPSLSITAGIWVLLMVVGLLASHVSNGKFGEDAIVGILSRLTAISPVFLVAFWIGGVAALFASADAQIYSYLLVSDFDVSTGKLRQRLMATVKPMRLAALFTLGFLTAYWTIRHFNIPLEKIIFIIVPFCLNSVPAFVLALMKRPQQPWYVASSVILYLSCAIRGLFQPSEEFTWTLAAALMPAMVSIVAWLMNVRTPRVES